MSWTRRTGIYGALLTLGIALVGIGATAPSAGAVLVSQTFDVQCNSPVGNQAQSVTVASDAPLEVESGGIFQVRFPGGSATLPSSALGGVVKIQQFTNLSNSY